MYIMFVWSWNRSFGIIPSENSKSMMDIKLKREVKKKSLGNKTFSARFTNHVTFQHLSFHETLEWRNLTQRHPSHTVKNQWFENNKPLQRYQQQETAGKLPSHIILKTWDSFRSGALLCTFGLWNFHTLFFGNKQPVEHRFSSSFLPGARGSTTCTQTLQETAATQQFTLWLEIGERRKKDDR